MSFALLQVSTGLLDLVGPRPPDVAYIKSYGKLLRLLKLTAILWKMVPFQVLLTIIFRGIVDFSDPLLDKKVFSWLVHIVPVWNKFDPIGTTHNWFSNHRM